MREEVEESKAASAKLQVEHACMQQAWQKDMLSAQAEHGKQVCKHYVLHPVMTRPGAYRSKAGTAALDSLRERLVSQHACIRVFVQN